MDLAVIITGFSVFIYLVLLALFLRSRNFSKASIRYQCFLIAGALWLLTGSLRASSMSENFNTDLLLAKFDFSSALLIAFFIALFSIHFPRNNLLFSFKKEIFLFIPISFFLVIVWLEKVFFGGFPGDLVYTKWYIGYFIVLLIYFILIPFGFLIKKRRNSDKIIKQQINYILIGYSITIFISLGASYYSAMIRNITNKDFGYLQGITIVFAALSSYAILRYRFMDIRVLIRKGFIYGVSLILTLAIFTYIALVLKSTIEESWNVNTTWTAAILIALVALGFPLLKKLVERAVDSMFKGRMSIDLAVKEVREAVAKKTDAQELAGAIAGSIKSYLNIRDVKIYLLDRRQDRFIFEADEFKREEMGEEKSDLVRLAQGKTDVIIRDEIPHLIEEGKGNGNLQRAEKDMKKRKITAYVPLKTEDELIGIITIGERVESTAYTVQDVQYLEHVRDQVTAPLANAIQYRDAMERIRLQMEGEGAR